MNSDQIPFELILPMLERDVKLLRISLPFIRNFIRPAKLTIIASSSCLESIRKLNILNQNEYLLDENKVVRGLNFEYVKKIFIKRGGDSGRSGWYFQQFLKLSYALRGNVMNYYLSLDVDTIPLRPIKFFDKDGKTLLTKKSEFHSPYFQTIKKLLALDRQVNFSFIAEHMMFNRDIVIELISKIINNNELSAQTLVERIFASLPDESLSHGFSEFETYGTFALNKYPQAIGINQILSIRNGSDYFGIRPSIPQLFSISLKYSFASFESWMVISKMEKFKGAIKRIVGFFWTLLALVIHPFDYFEYLKLNSQKRTFFDDER
jgi:hypothetical protein